MLTPILLHLFRQFQEHAEQLSIRDSASDDQAVVERWLFAQMLVTGFAMLLAETHNSEAADLLKKNRDWITNLVNEKTNEAETSLSHLKGPYSKFLYLLVATAALEDADLDGLGHEWKRIRESRTLQLLSVSSPHVGRAANELLRELEGQLLDRHPVIDLLRQVAN